MYALPSKLSSCAKQERNWALGKPLKTIGWGSSRDSLHRGQQQGSHKSRATGHLSKITALEGVLVALSILKDSLEVDNTMFWAALFTCSFLLLLLLLAWLWLSHSAHIHKKGLPPGKMGWPVAGQTLQFLASKPSLTSQPFIEKGSSRFGDVFKSHLFGQPFVVSTNTEVNQFVLLNEGVLFQSCQSISSPRWILGKHTLVETHGDLHSKVRAALAEVISPEKLKREIFDFLQDIILKRLPSWQDQFVHVQHEATYWVLCLLLDRLLCQPFEDLELQLLLSNYNDTRNLLAFPFNIPGSGYNKHAMGRERLVKCLKERIDRRRSAQSPMFGGFLDAMLREEENGSFTEKSNFILDTIMGILFHGEQTTAMAMTLMIKFLSETSRALEQVKGEHASLCKRKGKVEKLSWEDYESMKFTQSVVSESLRLANVIPWVCRVATQDVKIKGFVVPKGWKLLVVLMSGHLDAKNYGDPKNFDPWRWQDSSSESKFMPFGAGLRGCPGAEVARITLTVFLHFLVTRYSWQLVEDDEFICFPVMNFQEGFPIVVKSMSDADECLILH